MAEEAETGGERTEEPSQKRLQEARERGQVPRSRELTNFATMIGGSATLVAIGGTLAARMSEIMRQALSVDPQSLTSPDGMFKSLGEGCIGGVIGLLPLFGTLIGLVLLASVALGGWNFSPQAMTPDFTRLSPFAGLKRLLGLRGASELGKALLKCAVVGGVCAGVVSWLFGDVLALAHMAPRAAIGRGAGLLSWAFVWLCASLALVAVVDVPLQLFQFKRALRMTRQELRDEAKESDGRPETRQRIRQLQQQLAHRRRGDRQSHALRGGAQVRPQEHARAARARQGRRPRRAEHTAHRRGASGAGVRVAQTGARAVPIDRFEQGNSRRSVRGCRPGSVLHIPGAHSESDRRRAGGASESASRR
jgi:flagellar biosynthetic protein FlhB